MRSSPCCLAAEPAAFTATEAIVPIARLERAVRPEDLAPPPGTVCDLFVFIDQPDVLVAERRSGGSLPRHAGPRLGGVPS
jgi:hypothetical protein